MLGPLDSSHLFVPGLNGIVIEDELVLHVGSKAPQTPDSMLLFFLNLEREKNVNSRICVMVNTHGVHYCVLTVKLSWEFIKLIHSYFSFSPRQ